MRLFFALWPDENVRQEFLRVAGQLSLNGRSRLVRAANYHLTMAFLGEVPQERLAVMQQIGFSMRAPGFTVHCTATEFWSRSQAIVVVAREIPPALLELVRRLHSAIGLWQSPFRPHVTLARKIAQAPVLPVMSQIAWRVQSFSLIRSDTGGTESAYTVLDTWPLLYES